MPHNNIPERISKMSIWCPRDGNAKRTERTKAYNYDQFRNKIYQMDPKPFRWPSFTVGRELWPRGEYLLELTINFVLVVIYCVTGKSSSSGSAINKDWSSLGWSTEFGDPPLNSSLLVATQMAKWPCHYLLQMRSFYCTLLANNKRVIRTMISSSFDIVHRRWAMAEELQQKVFVQPPTGSAKRRTFQRRLFLCVKDHWGIKVHNGRMELRRNLPIRREYAEINNRFICYPFEEHCSPKLTSNCRKTVYSVELEGGWIDDPTCHPPTRSQFAQKINLYFLPKNVLYEN